MRAVPIPWRVARAALFPAGWWCKPMLVAVLGAALLAAGSVARASIAPRVATEARDRAAERPAVELALATPTGRETRRLNRSQRLRSITRGGSDGLSERLPPAVRRCHSPGRLWRQWERLRMSGYAPWGGGGKPAPSGAGRARGACP